MDQMNRKKLQFPPSLYQEILNELTDQSVGMSEFELIKALRLRGFFQSSANTAMKPLELFQTHFLLFHALYMLRDQLFESQTAWLSISALQIGLMPYQQGKVDLAKFDKLREYYLDFSHMENTSEDDVCELIASFWTKVSSHEQRDESLAILGLNDPVSDFEIKKAYRRLAMQHHPDRGGEKEKLQAINLALNKLLN